MKSPAACSPVIALAIFVGNLSHCANPPRERENSAFAGSERCAACHQQEARFRGYGPHRAVECERCHGPGGEHARAGNQDRSGLRLGDRELCLSCHVEGADPSSNTVSTIESFEDHLRNLERDHRVTLDRQKSGTNCIYCHDPHLLE